MTTKKIILTISLLLGIASGALAGSRPGEFALVNVSKQPMNKEGQRLFELIEKDLKMLYNDGKYGFAWEASDTKIKTVDTVSQLLFIRSQIPNERAARRSIS